MSSDGITAESGFCFHLMPTFKNKSYMLQTTMTSVKFTDECGRKGTKRIHFFIADAISYTIVINN